MSHRLSKFIVQLNPILKNYEWGKKLYQNGFITQLIQKNHPSLINDDESYAELWMGIHPSGMSTTIDNGEPLSKWIDDKNEKLNFLFKVLSIAKPLSIQVHPDKSVAQLLHQTRPDLYADDNHKPEMAIALCDGFEALIGFRPISEINQSKLFQVMIKRLIQIDPNHESMSHLGSIDDLIQLIHVLLHLDQSLIENIHQSMIVNAKHLVDDDSLLFHRLCKFYPNDVGCFFACLMNHITLQKDEAIFIKPGQLHAYICGDIVECMACSDNVIRAGLTPKHKDVDNLLRILTQTQHQPSETIFVQPLVIDDCTQIYQSSITDEFKVARILVDKHQRWSFTTPTYGIVLISSGSASMKCESSSESQTIDIKMGMIFCAKPGCTLIVDSSKDQAIEIWIAHN